MRVDARRGASHSSSLEAAPPHRRPLFLTLYGTDLDQQSSLRGKDRACHGRNEASFRLQTLGRPRCPPKGGMT